MSVEELDREGEKSVNSVAKKIELARLAAAEANATKAQLEARKVELELANLKKTTPTVRPSNVSATMTPEEKELSDKARKNGPVGSILKNLGFSDKGAKEAEKITTAISSDKELGVFERIKLAGGFVSLMKTDIVKKISVFAPAIGLGLEKIVNWFSNSWVGGLLGLSVSDAEVPELVKSDEEKKDDVKKMQTLGELPYNLRGDVYDQGLQIIADKESSNGKFVWNAQDHKHSSWGVFQFQGPVFHGFVKFLSKKGKKDLAEELKSFYERNNYKKGKSISKTAKNLSDQCRKEQLDFVKQTQLMSRVGEMKEYLPASLQQKRSPITTLLIYNITHQCGWNLRISILKEAKKNYSNEKLYQKALIAISKKKASSKSDIEDRMQKILRIKAVPNPHPKLNQSVEVSPAKPFTTPYISFVYSKNLPENQIEKNLERQLGSLGYPDTLFVDNSKNQNPKTVKKSINILKILYAKKGKFPKIFMDNENGTVQRVIGYLGTAGPKEKELQDLLDKYVPQAGSLDKGAPSMRSMEKLFEKLPNRQKELIESYAEIRIKNEKSLGLNSVSLVLDEGADSVGKNSDDVINIRGFKNSAIRKMYAKALIEKASEKGMNVLLKHFPGHKGIPNPHFKPLSTKKELNAEMKTFLEILDWTKEKGRKNVIVMLGHIKLNIPNTEWNSEGKPIFASSKVMTKLHKDYPDITFMTDDIGGMDAIKHKEKARNEARKNKVFALN